MEDFHLAESSSSDEDKSKIKTEQAEVIAEIRLCMMKETDPQDPEVVILAEKWVALMDEASAGDGIVGEELHNMVIGGVKN